MSIYLHLSALLLLLLFLSLDYSQAAVVNDESRVPLKSAVFQSPKFTMTPGSVINKFYPDIPFPKGHIGLKSSYAELVDEAGIPVPLHETYLHHWSVARYYQNLSNSSDRILSMNPGICQNLGQTYGIGSETRRTSFHVPHPYAIELGNPDEVPAGYEDSWMLNVHAIDMRGVVDKYGCSECRCDLYNITKDVSGRPLEPGYKGGELCCYDQTRCKLRQGFDAVSSSNASRGFYLRYTVKWVDWDKSLLLPVQIYIFDVIDDPVRAYKDQASHRRHMCPVEYQVEPCNSSSLTGDVNYVHSKKSSFMIPEGGYVIYAVGHQHSGGSGTALLGEDGRLICFSKPIYGDGEEAGNEKGYVVGMSTCYPQPGSVKLLEGETVSLVSNYSSAQMHTGVMGIFYLLVADQIMEPMNYSDTQIDVQLLQVLQKINTNLHFVGWATFSVGVVILAAVIVLLYCSGQRRNNKGYMSITS